MSFSPIAFLTSCLLTGSAVIGLLTADDRWYRVSGGVSGIFIVPDKSFESRNIMEISSYEDMTCSVARPFDVDIRQQEDWANNAGQQKRSSPGRAIDSNFHFATTTMPREYEFSREWPKVCGASDNKNIIEVSPNDVGLPVMAVPLSSKPEEEVYACFKITTAGKVSDVAFPESMDKYPRSMPIIIERTARNCWSFENKSGVEGWIQAGIDRRIFRYDAI